MILGIVGIGLVVIIIIYCIATYNGLVGLRNRVKDQWAQIDVQLKRRFDLIPNLIETVKGYAAHEKGTLQAVIDARNQFSSAQTPNEEADANSLLTKACGKLFALAESYPDLKANVNFLQLQDELSKVEDKIAVTRQFYNDCVLSLNNKIEMFPSSIVAGMGHFQKETFLETEGSERANVKVKFN